MTDTALTPAAKPVKRPWLSPLNKRRWQEFQGQPARLLVAVDFPVPACLSTLFGIHRQ